MASRMFSDFVLAKSLALLADGEPERWGLLELTNAASRLPNAAGVYLASSADTVLYVGQSKSLCQRWRNHKQLPRIREASGTSLVYVELQPHNLTSAEAALMDHFMPVLNINRNFPSLCGGGR